MSGYGDKCLKTVTLMVGSDFRGVCLWAISVHLAPLLVLQLALD